MIDKSISRKHFIPFKYKLGLLLFIVGGIVVGILGFSEFFYMKNILQENFRENMDLVTDRIISSVSDADHMLLTVEKQLEQEAEKILTDVKRRYEETGDINFDLSEFLSDTPHIDLYIIDRRNQIVKTTDEKELGMDFNQYPDFAVNLNGMRLQQGFFSHRVSQSIVESKMKKFCYLISDDRQYIFETGSLLERDNNLLVIGTGFDNFEQRIMEDNSRLLEKIVMYDYTGVSYKKDQSGNPYTVDSEALPFYLEAEQKMKTVERVVDQGDRSLYYQYVPYHIAAFQGVNDVNVIEIIYHDTLLRENLKNSLQFVIIVAVIGAVFVGLVAMFFADRISGPIRYLTSATSQIALGNFDIKIQIDSNDELQLLGEQFQKMADSINELLQGRTDLARELAEKNREIMQQKEEITALFEETYAINEELESALEENRQNYFATVWTLANSIEVKDAYTGGHCERVMEYSMEIAKELGIYPHDINHLKFGSILHDVGKIGIPETVLNKEGKFTEQEYELMKMHPQFGAKIIENIPFLERSRNIILQHHERVDGKGYPQGLKGEEIDILARIVCVADAYDAMTSERPYRKQCLTQEQVIEELIVNRGAQFDEQVVDVFVRCLLRKTDYNKLT